MFVIGIDCATDLRNVGVATGIVAGARPVVENVTQISAPSLARLISRARSEGHQVLIALDAPLGWPVPLAQALGGHRAGERIDVDAHKLFRRTTDIAIYAITGRPPLDVGADRIARTAHATLALLAELRRLANDPLPLIWQSRFPEPAGCIEVYPAATLWAHRIPNRGYKGDKPEHAAERLVIADQLGQLLELPPMTQVAMAASDHAIDAATCVLAAADFLAGESQPPENLLLAQQEGWIWVRSRSDF
jgi:predicted RNase H-like nuclease